MSLRLRTYFQLIARDCACRLKVVVMEVKDLSSLSSNKIVYCTMEVDGGDKLQTDQAEASKPWSLSTQRVLVCN